jgi:hypothetical protein
MAVWEYKVISSGKGGFATPALLESFLNQLGKDEWEIVEFRTQPDNVLACTGLARRPTQRDWTLEDAAAAAARTEADKLRAEFEAKFKGAAGSAGLAPETGAPAAEPAPDDGYRKIRDTERDLDPEAPDEEGGEDEWDKVGAEDELPTFFEALRPHLRRNQRGPGMSVGVDYLAKKWDLAEDDVLGALKECGLALPEDEDTKPAYVEYDGDLFWVNMNRRGELWINTKEKPRPVFRTVAATPLAPDDAALAAASGAPAPLGDDAGSASDSSPASSDAGAPGELPERMDRADRTNRSEGGDRPERGGRGGRGDRSRGEVFSPKSRGEAAGAPLPVGPALLDRIRPMMRRNRREPGGSGSISFLSRGLKCSEADLIAAFASLGLTAPANAGDRPEFVEIGDYLWWVNQDQRGGVWINARDKSDGIPADSAPESGEAAGRPANASAMSAADPVPGEASSPSQPETAAFERSSTEIESAPADAFFSPILPAEPELHPPAASDPGSILAGVRLLLKRTRTGGAAGRVDRLADGLGRSADDLIQALAGTGLSVPGGPDDKPVFVEHAGEIFWFNRNAKEELWLNAKASKFGGAADEEAGAETGGSRSRRAKKGAEAEAEAPAPAPESLSD